MKKGTKIRNVLTDEMMGLIRNKQLTDAQVGALLRSIIYPGEFDQTDMMVQAFARTFFTGYLELTLSCAESKSKELERLNKHYSKSGVKKPAWFDEYYKTLAKRYANVICALSNAIDNANNDSFSFANVSEALDNVSLTLGNVNTIPIPTQHNTNTNDTDTVCIPPKSPEGGLTGARQPPSILDAPEDLTTDEDDDGGVTVESIAAEVEKGYPYKINRGKLRKCLTSVLKKNAAAEVLSGYRAWFAAWEASQFRWAPSRIIDFFYDRKFLEPPRQMGSSGPAKDPDTVSQSANLDLV